MIAPEPSAASPTFNPAPGTFKTPPTVALASTTPGASIFFTTNGTTPTTASTKYTAPFKVNSTETVEAIATAAGFKNSAVVIGAYTINASATPAATPTFNPKAGTYATAQNVSLSDATSGAAIFYTTDGTTPTTSSSKYTGALSVTKSETIKAIAVASGHTDSAVASAAYTITQKGPTGLSYTVPPPLLVGKAVSLTPTVTGTVTAYAVNPSLPKGLTLNPTSGLISGKPTAVTASATYTVKASNSSGSTTFSLPLKVDSGPTVHLTATASTATGATLVYAWKTTDGKLLNTSGNQTDWELPPGFGFHFAYVLVSDGRSGYTVGRMAVNTDSFGAPQIIPIGNFAPADESNGQTTTPARQATPSRSGARPSVLFTAGRPVSPPSGSTLSVGGSVELGDHNLAGISDPFFGLLVNPTVSLTNATCLSDADCPSPAATGKFGEFEFSSSDPPPVGSTVTVNAFSENAGAATSFTLTQADLDAGRILSPLLLGNSSSPDLTKMTASYNGAAVGAFQHVWPNALGQPSDGYPQQNWFLSYLGSDSKRSSCAYYLAVARSPAAIRNGNFSGAINFTQWRRKSRSTPLPSAGDHHDGAPTST